MGRRLRRRAGSKSVTGCDLTSGRLRAPDSAIIARRVPTGKRQFKRSRVRESANLRLRRNRPHLRTLLLRQEVAWRRASLTLHGVSEPCSNHHQPIHDCAICEKSRQRGCYTASLQKRRNSQETQRARFAGGGGMRSAATIVRIALTTCPTRRRSCGVISTSSALRSGR